ncbi:efflux RND transporter permease subunit [Longimicrobium sp.]|uniref:efflux RND transporter permease subunit n=1 Tax=Longimicrobium sp. TaxID=2029185 RepID=UPI003B3BACBA
MFISDFAIKRPVVTTVTMLALVVFGLFALFSLDTDEFPEVEAPFIFISVPYPGASPDIVEREVVDPIEEAVAGISGVDQIQSQALDGFASIQVIFVYGIDPKAAAQDIRDAVSQIRGDLPQEMEEPILARFDPNDQPIVSLSLASSTLTPAELTRIADPGITRELRGVPGVAEVQVAGGVERELSVEVDPSRLQAAGLSIPQVVAALQTQNLAVPVGRLNSQLEERTIRLRGRLVSPAEFSQLVVAAPNGVPVRLAEVATVRDGTEEPRSLALFNGQPAVGIDLVKAQGYSTTSVAEVVIERVAEIQKTLPAGAKLTVVRNSGERVENSVANVEETLVVGALLTVLVVFMFLNSWRSTVITGLALPVSVLASFVAVLAFGFTLNTMSLLGLSLAIGILIDDAIVVRENIVRHVEMGKDHYRAAREGTDEIGLAVAATTFSIVCVFVPIAFMGGLAEQWFAPFALTIACSVLVSLFVSFSLDPMLSAYWPDPHREEHEKAWITRQLDKFNRWFDRRADDYRHVIAWALDHALAMVLIAIGSFVGALVIPAKGIFAFLAVMVVITAAVLALTFFRFPRGFRGVGMKGGIAVGTLVLMFVAIGAAPAGGKLGFEFFPKDDNSEILVDIDTPPGSSLEYTRLKSEEVASMARRIPEVLYTYTTIGAQGGAVDQGNVYVRLKPKAERDKGQEEIAAGLREQAKRIGGATAALGTGNFGGTKQIMIQLQGPDIAVLNQLAEQVEAQVRQVPGAVDVSLSTKGQKPELTVELNRGLAGSLGVTAAQVAQAMRPAFAGIDVGDWVDPSGETRDVYVRFNPEARSRTADLARVPLVLPGAGGQATTLPLGQVATITRELGPAQINHLDRERVINVEANTQDRPLSEVVGDITTRIQSVRMPVGYQLTFGGDTEDQTEVFGRIMFALLVAVMLMYLILVVQFGSFLDPLAILLSLPLSLIGVVLGLWIAGSTLNLMSMIGIIMLMGIVAKNAILLIDFAKWAKESGKSTRDALIEAGAIRLRPILMTTFALIAGMLPVALGSGEGAQFRAPMGIAIIGGVATSTLLTLLVIPTVWELLDEMRESFLRRFRGKRGDGGHGGGHGGHDVTVPHEPRMRHEPEPALRMDAGQNPSPGLA